MHLGQLIVYGAQHLIPDQRGLLFGEISGFAEAGTDAGVGVLRGDAFGHPPVERCARSSSERMAAQSAASTLWC